MEATMSGLTKIGSAISGFFAVIARFFSEFGTAMAKGDVFVKLSLLWWGAGYFRRKQYVKAILMTLLEIAVIVFTLNFAMAYVPKFGTLGTVQAEQVFNMQTMQTEWNDYDNSFMILLFSLFSFVIWFVAAVVCMRNVVNAYELQMQAQRNNITTEEHPMGVYHPHANLHHIKKENIGLIEVMGLAVLPSRLKTEMAELADALVNGLPVSEYSENIAKHAQWAQEIQRSYEITRDNVEDILRKEIGMVFAQVLEDAGVYKLDESGRVGFERFLASVR